VKARLEISVYQQPCRGCFSLGEVILQNNRRPLSRYLWVAGLFRFLPLLAMLLLVRIATGQTSPSWTTYQHDYRHSGLSPHIGAQTNNAQLIYDLGSGNARPHPVVGGNGLIYLAFESPANGSNWRLIAVNPNGSPIINVTYPGRAGAPPTLADDGAIYVPVDTGSDGSNDLYCLFPDGTFKWKKSLRGLNAPVTLGPDGIIYVSRGSFQNNCQNILLALNPDGSNKWVYNYSCLDNLQSAAFAPNSNIIVTGITSGGLRFVEAHDSTDGHLLWQQFIGNGEAGAISSPSVATDGTIYVWYNRLWALGANGQVSWSTPFLTPFTGSTPAIAPDGSVLVAVSNYGPGGASKLQSFLPSGQPQWSIDLVQGIGFVDPQVGVDAQGTGFVSFNSTQPLSASTSVLFAVNNDGSLKWSYSATIANTIIIGSSNTAYAALFDNVPPQGNGSWKIYSFGSASPPVCTITCTTNITGPNTPGQCGAIVNYPAPTTTGTCSTVNCAPPSGSFFPVGTTNVACTASAGPSCSFTVTVIDNILPTITCTGNISVMANPGDNCVVVSYPAPTATDNCLSVTKVCLPPSGSCFPIGATTVNCTATDSSNNGQSCSFSITVSGKKEGLLSDGFDYPVSNVFRPTRTQGDADGWYVTNYFGHNLPEPPCTLHIHPGDDWNRDDGNDAGETVKAVSNGTVVAIKQLKNANKQPLGEGIVISHTLQNGSIVYSVYVHVAASSSIKPNTTVHRNEPIATIANIRGLGSHLHFEIRTTFNKSDWYPNDDGCGYYENIATILSLGFRDPVDFIDQHRP
jgi:hypothetical protein